MKPANKQSWNNKKKFQTINTKITEILYRKSKLSEKLWTKKLHYEVWQLQSVVATTAIQPHNY